MKGPKARTRTQTQTHTDPTPHTHTTHTQEQEQKITQEPELESTGGNFVSAQRRYLANRHLVFRG